MSLEHIPIVGPFWSIPIGELYGLLDTKPEGLAEESARARQAVFHARQMGLRRDRSPFHLLVRQFRNPIVIILICAAFLSLFLADPTDALIIFTIIAVSGLLGFWQEHSAAKVMAALFALVRIKADVWRDARVIELPVEDIVPGDVIDLSAGSTVPGDAVIIDSRALFVDEATLTGESYPAEKCGGVVGADAPLISRKNSLFMGTHVVSGWARALVARVGTDTEFGRIARQLASREPETEFEHGVRRFGYLLLEVTLVLVFVIFAINVWLKRPVLDSLLFSMALAVGLTPQLLPAIISVNLAYGAKRMAGRKVIVKRLSSIEDFGSMNVFCSDKTGTLTEGTMVVHAALNVAGASSDRVLLHAFINASFETGYSNPMDEALRKHQHWDATQYRKLDEQPYDFMRKRLSVLVAAPQTHLLITKGAVDSVLGVCSSMESAEGRVIPLEAGKTAIRQQISDLNRQGFRTIGVAYRDMNALERIDKCHEAEMVFLGIVVFAAPLKAGITDTVAALRRNGVLLKIISGDHRLVVSHVARQVGLDDGGLLTGEALRHMTDDALLHRVNDVHVFAEVEPNQKNRIIQALKQAGNVVGYIGDGINDAPALHSADVGISVDGAVDVAKEAADIVLLEKDLTVLVDGVREGRTTFANTLKYVFMATSANFGNMFSMAGASLFLPFLPLLPKQILLTNLLTDIPEMTIATDRVDAELIDRPRRWDIGFIRKFMLTFGLISSVFDYLTFGALVWLFEATPEQFRTGWFVESVVSASMIVLVIRTRRSFVRSPPSSFLVASTGAVIILTISLPFLPIASPFGLTPLPLSFVMVLGVILAGYVLAAEMAKSYFYGNGRA
ncbi:MAG TPA: magnesium-translocating P-type ATPase [Nitrospira sp.]